jgi:cytosine/adenosine deaminase-related metal-dependent hydrolase
MYLTAPLIHDGYRFLQQGTGILTDDSGTIIRVIPPGGDEPSGDEQRIELSEGILCPGFVNAHCHIELSHLAGVVPEHTGLMSFLQHVIGRRGDASAEEKQMAREAAYQYMLDAGIVAVGDIVNTTDTLELRQRGKLHIHSFIETIGVDPSRAEDSLGRSKARLQAFEDQAVSPGLVLGQSITAHAPYSVSEPLFRAMSADREGSLLSVHNQETEDENSYYRDKTGGVCGFLRRLGVDDGFFEPSRKSSLATYGEWIETSHPLILVHNTFSDVEDIKMALERFPHLYWCLCPGANQYIEGEMPPVARLLQLGARICIGTDSLASNHQLSVYEELKLIKEHDEWISWEQLLSWGTIGGACALQMGRLLGSIEPGKKPGIVHISDSGEIKRLV